MARIEDETLCRAKENMENALKVLTGIDNVKSAAWQDAWQSYKRLASDYRTLLCYYYNLQED